MKTQQMAIAQENPINKAHSNPEEIVNTPKTQISKPLTIHEVVAQRMANFIQSLDENEIAATEKLHSHLGFILEDLIAMMDINELDNPAKVNGYRGMLRLFNTLFSNSSPFGGDCDEAYKLYSRSPEDISEAFVDILFDQYCRRDDTLHQQRASIKKELEFYFGGYLGKLSMHKRGSIDRIAERSHLLNGILKCF